MNNHDWERFGEDIRRTIQDAVEYGNYDRLNQTIRNTVNQATDWVSRNVNNAQGYHGQTYRADSYTRPNVKKDVQRQYQRKTQEFFAVKASSKVAGILFVIFGYGLSAGIFVLSLIFLIASIVLDEVGVGLGFTMFGMLLMAGFIIMAIIGTGILTRISRFKKYVKEIGAAEFCNIADLARCVQKPEKFVVKDLEKMISKNWFKQGHLDRQKTCLIVTDEMYQQYRQLEEQKDMQRREAEKAEQMQAASRQGLSPEVQKVIEQGDAYVKKIRKCNDDIPGEEISEKIYRIEVVVDKIFDRVEQNPESVSDIRKLMDYYLPTTVKLLEAYAQMDAQPVGGENIRTAKKEIEATLDTLNVAFEKLLDSLFQDAAWDVSSDISVLNTMLAQEGLKDDGLKK